MREWGSFFAIWIAHIDVSGYSIASVDVMESSMFNKLSDGQPVDPALPHLLASAFAYSIASADVRVATVNAAGSCESSNLADSLLEEGIKYLNAWDLLKAERVFKDALRALPGNSKLYYLLATVFQRQGKPQRAADANDSALAHNPRHAESLVQKGFMEYHLLHLEYAENAFRGALISCPREINCYFGLGLVFLSQGRFDWAESALKSVLGLDKNAIGVWGSLAEAQHAMGSEEASKSFHNAASELLLQLK